MEEINIIDIDENNVLKYGLCCVNNPKHEGYRLKLDWLKMQFQNGIKIKLLYSNTDGPVGFIEYIPGEYSWRAIKADGYYMIHCIWIKSKKYQGSGNASLLINSCIKDSVTENRIGVTVVSSSGPFLAGKEIFIKNGFEIADSAPPGSELLVKKNRNGPDPEFNVNWESRLKKYSGLNIIYANQCPYVAKSVKELVSVAKSRGLCIKTIKLKTPEEAQNAPSPYGVFSIVYNGRLLADHYISERRFNNILNKEIL